MFDPSRPMEHASPYSVFERDDQRNPLVSWVNSHHMLMVPRGPFTTFVRFPITNALFESTNRLYTSDKFTAVTPGATVYVMLAV